MKLRVCHYPQMPCDAFEVEVSSLKEAQLISNALANYDLFQYEKNIKPDYANATVVEIWNESVGIWEDWFDEETGIDDINEYFETLESQQN